jgi:hypothetical protein
MKFLNKCPSSYPNAASYRYYLEKAIDSILTIVSAAGAVCALAFLVTL